MIAAPRFLIAAAHKSSGKTVISTGLARAFADLGQQVQTFKKGPDYIDPMWLSLATRRPCFNLDFNTQGRGEITDLFAARAASAQLSIIETNKGLFDGVDPDGADSNTALARLLDVPVVLVVDTTGITRGIAPLLQGYMGFEEGLRFGGVILNKVAGARHEAKLVQAVETYCDLPVLGAIRRNDALNIGERHLGLTTPAEMGEVDQMVQRFGEIVGASVDLDRVQAIAKGAPALADPAPVKITTIRHQRVRIGIARDAAFGFYYADDLEHFAAAGADLVPVDLTRDAQLPALDGLFIGGGFPECRMAALAENETMRADVAAAIAGGLPTYAECGGLMYLCRSLSWRGTTAPMAGVIAADAVMHERPQGRGHVVMAPRASHPWLGDVARFKAHEFHYASLENVAPDTVFAQQVCRGHGIDGQHDAIVTHNLVAGFAHLRHTQALPWIDRFTAFVRAMKKPRQG